MSDTGFRREENRGTLLPGCSRKTDSCAVRPTRSAVAGLGVTSRLAATARSCRLLGTRAACRPPWPVVTAALASSEPE